jgi:cytochrome oxidase Cu insertion factor (SCO1/SenC/PrrC family)
VVKPHNTKSFGELVQPQRPMPELAATSLDGKATTLQSLRGQWLLVSVAGGECGKTCEAHLYMQRQLRETLGREKDRLDWVWLITDDVPLTQELQARLTDVNMKARGFAALRIKESELATWLQVAPDKASSASLAARLYLVDPQGHYMMRFPENMTIEQAAKAKSDINRLLKASSFWDTAGRENLKK